MFRFRVRVGHGQQAVFGVDVGARPLLQVIKRWCAWCHRWQAPKLDLQRQVLGQGCLGVRIASLVAYLRTTARLPVRRMRAYLQTLQHLTLSTGEIVELLHQLRPAAQPAVAARKAAARASPILHIDETRWREGGQNGYVWGIRTPGADGVRYYEYDRTRTGGIATRLVGMPFRGHLGTAFSAGYTHRPGPHQRCWVPLRRDLHALREQQGRDRRVRQLAGPVTAVYRYPKSELLPAHPYLTARLAGGSVHRRNYLPPRNLLTLNHL